MQCRGCLPKTPLAHMCYHAEFGCSRSNHVPGAHISRGEPQNWHPLGPRRLEMEGVTDHLKQAPPHVLPRLIWSFFTV